MCDAFLMDIHACHLANVYYAVFILGCGHCKAMKPAFAEAAAKLHDQKVHLFLFLFHKHTIWRMFA